jgi:hypothetical protein
MNGINTQTGAASSMQQVGGTLHPKQVGIKNRVPQTQPFAFKQFGCV